MSATTQSATAYVDLDVFEDVNGDFIHDDSAAGEIAEGSQPTELPYAEEDGYYTELALIVSGATPTATVSFNYSQSELQLFFDIMGVYPINSGEAFYLEDIGISGSGTIPLFAKAMTAELSLQSSGSVGVQLGNGSTGSNSALDGGTSRMDYYQYGTYPRSEIMGVDLRGLAIVSNAVNTLYVRVDTLGTNESVNAWTHPLNDLLYDGVMMANQVNHRTIVWWVQDLAVLELA